MGEIATSNRQITLYYNSKSARAKQTLAYAIADGFKVEEIDILKTKLTGTQIVELAKRLHITVADLINQDKSYEVELELFNCKKVSEDEDDG